MPPPNPESFRPFNFCDLPQAEPILQYLHAEEEPSHKPQDWRLMLAHRSTKIPNNHVHLDTIATQILATADLPDPTKDKQTPPPFPHKTTSVLYKEHVTSLPDDQFAYIEKLIVSQALQRLIDLTAEFPSAAEITESNFDKPTLKQILLTTLKCNRVCEGVLREFALTSLNRESSLANTILAHLNHDHGNMLNSLDITAGTILESNQINAQTGRDEPPMVKEIKTYLLYDIDIHKALLTQIYECNLALVSDQFPLEKFNVHAVMQTSLANLSHRLKYQVVNHPPSTPLQEFPPGTFINMIDPDLYLHGHASSIAQYFFHTGKNAVKTAHHRGQPNPCIIFQAKNIGSNCVSLLVKDTGSGLSFNEMETYYTQEAHRKLEAEEPLDLLEQILLNERYRDHITPKALSRRLFHQGESFTKGTGLGLAIIKHIVAAHQGHIRIYNHPQLGACVQIILPNTPDKDPVIRYRLVQTALKQAYLDDLPS